MPSFPSDYVFQLVYDDYDVLSELKDSVNKEIDAMRTIVATANMNHDVLLRDMMEKRRRAIARIDASREGQGFLSFLLTESSGDELSSVKRRVVVGEQLVSSRKHLNKQLYALQERGRSYGLDNLNRRIMLVRFIDDMISFLNSGSVESILTENFDEDVDFHVDLFVNSILVEELESLRILVNRKPK